MIQALIEGVLETGLQAIGWAVLKVVTFGRYQGFQPEDVLVEGSVGLGTVFVVCYGGYRLMF